MAGERAELGARAGSRPPGSSLFPYCWATRAELLPGGGGAGRGDADAVPGQEHRDGEDGCAERRDQEAELTDGRRAWHCV